MLDLRPHLVHANVFVDLPGNCICTTVEPLGCALPGSKGWSVPHCRRVGWGLRELLACSCALAALCCGREKPKTAELCPFRAHTVSRGGNRSQTWGKKGSPMPLDLSIMGSPLTWCHTRHVLSHQCPSGLAGGSPGPALWGLCGLNLLCLDTVAHSFAAEPGWP